MSSGDLALHARDADVTVLRADGLSIAGGPEAAPHRHDFHELIWTRAGRGEHLIDGEPVPVQPGSVTLIGRGQVHEFARAEDVEGWAVRFADEALVGGGPERPGAWLLLAREPRVIPVPAADAERAEAVIRALADESTRPGDACTPGLEAHLLMTLLLWLERWYDAAREEACDAADADLRLLRRFTERLEHDYAAHHDAAHYADALGVAPAHLAQTLVALTGRSTKEHVLDRVMVEAARLLRFGDLTVGEVAFQVGFRDPLYFSSAFKRHTGRSPLAYRRAVRGRAA